MPALTVPHSISIYWFLPDDRFPELFQGLIREIKPKDSAGSVIDALGNLLACSCAWEMHLSLTAQRRDYYGNARPYDCEDLVEFLVDGTTLDPAERVFHRFMPPADIAVLRGLIQRTLQEPLFPDEKAQWEALDRQLAVTPGSSLVSVYSL
jgi:hypothetical protein